MENQSSFPGEEINFNTKTVRLVLPFVLVGLGVLGVLAGLGLCFGGAGLASGEPARIIFFEG